MNRMRRIRWWRWLVAAAGLVPLGAVVRYRELPPIAAVAFAPDGRSLATASYGRWGEAKKSRAEVRAWNLAKGRERRAERRDLGDLALVIEGGDRLVARWGDGRTVPLAEVTSWPVRTFLQGWASWAFGCVAVASPDGRRLATTRHRANGLDESTVRVWDVATGRLVRALDPAGRVDVLAWAPDGRTVAGAGGTLSAWDVESGAVLGWTRGAPQGVAPLAFAPAGGMLAVQALGSKLTCLDAGDGRVGPTFKFLQADALTFAPDGRRLAVGDNEGQVVVTVFDLESGRPVTTFRGHERPSATVEEARRLTGNAIDELRRRTGANLDPVVGKLMTLFGNTVCGVAFSPDGRLIASGDSDGTAWVWDATTGAEVARFDHGAGASGTTLGLACAWAAACLAVACRRWKAADRGAQSASLF